MDGSEEPTGPRADRPGVAESYGITRGAAMLSVGVAVGLVILKGGAWVWSGSVAMLASLADSTLDLAASLFTYFAIRYAAQPPDREHRFGHGKAEAFAGLFQAGLVAVSCALVAVESLKRFVDPQPIQHGWLAIAVMAVSIAATAALILAQSRAIARTGSVAVKGDRAHYAADLAGNLAVIVGVAAGAFLGWAWADAVAALFVAGWLALGAVHVAREAADQLMDRELPDADRARIAALALEDPTIKTVHALRTRESGALVHIQFHVDLDPDMSLRDAHAVIVAAEARIRAAFPTADILIHPDPRDSVVPHGHAFFAGQGRDDP